MLIDAVKPITNFDHTNQILAIIDSRLQFISYKMEEFSARQFDQKLGSSRSDSMTFVQQTNLSFQIIERLTRQKSRLLTIRKYVNAQNIDIAYNLLQNDAYLNHSVQELKCSMLKMPRRLLDNKIPRSSTVC